MSSEGLFLLDKSTCKMMMDLDSVEIDQFETEDVGEFEHAQYQQAQRAHAQAASYAAMNTQHHTAAASTARKPEKAKWSQQEDSVLQQAVSMHDGKNWKSIASFLKGKTEVQCLHRWTKVLNLVSRRGRGRRRRTDLWSSWWRSMEPRSGL